NAQGEDEPREGRPAAGVDGVEQIARGDIGEPFQLDDLLIGQTVQIRWRTDQAAIDQLLDDLVAQPVDIHRAARNEMDDRLLELRLAGQTADTTVDRAFAD